MEDWATFLFTGSNVLPAFMVLANDESFGLALFVYVGLLLAACIAGLMDEDCPARQAARVRIDERRDRRDDE